MTRIIRIPRSLLAASSSALPFLFAACGGDADAKATDNSAAPIAVAVARVSSDADAQPVTLTGTWASRDEIPLSFKIGGVIARVNVDQGAVVPKGQALAALDVREIDASAL